jgi:hypothetical protein
LAFDWYPDSKNSGGNGTTYYIGNLRGDGIDSYGFGIGKITKHFDSSDSSNYYAKPEEDHELVFQID